MEGSIIELSKYRFSNAEEELKTAHVLIQNKLYRASVANAYYAIFHGLRAVTALDGFDSSKHSGIISYFNKEYVKTGIIDKEVSEAIKKTLRVREEADYKDFVIINDEQAKKQIILASRVLDILRPYLKKRWSDK